MTNEMEVVYLQFTKDMENADGLMTPRQVEQALRQYVGPNSPGSASEEEVAKTKHALMLFRDVVDKLSLDPTVPVFNIGRQGNTLSLIWDNTEWLYFHLDTYSMDDKLHEYITQVTRQVPSNGSDEMLKKIAPPMHMSRHELATFMMHTAKANIYEEVKALVGKIMDDYPCDAIDRKYVQMSAQFNVSRVEIPDGNLNGENGSLVLEMIVADKGHWNVAGRIKMLTGWRVAYNDNNDNWFEHIVHVERALGDEPRENAYPGKAGIYAYIPEATDLRFPDLIETLKGHVLANADQSMRTLINCLSARAYGKTLSFAIERVIKGGAVDLPNAYGSLLIKVRADNQELGAIDLMTQWSHVSKLGLDRTEHPDFLELVGQASLNRTAEEAWAKLEQSRGQRWGGFGDQGYAPFGGQFGHRWGGGPSGLNGWGGQGGMFGQWRPFGGGMGGMQIPFAEEASLSTARLDSFGRILMATVENMPVIAIVPEVLGALRAQRESYNQAQHGPLLYQFELKPGFGLAVRVISQSGVTHFQQVFPA